MISQALVSCAVMGALAVLNLGSEDLEAAGIGCGDANAADDGVSDEYAYLLGQLPKRIRNLYKLTYRQLKLIGDDKIVRAINHRLGRPWDSPLSFEELRAIVGVRGVRASKAPWGVLPAALA